jgi:hypothetical protein
MKKTQYTLTKTDLTLLIDIIRNSELYTHRVEGFKIHYKMSQKAAKIRAGNITTKLVRQRELCILNEIAKSINK